MAVAISTLKSEVLSDLQVSSSNTTLYTAADFVAWTNDFYSEYGAKMKLEGRVAYTWPASQESVALSSVSSTATQVNRIELLDDDGNVNGEWEKRMKGGSDGIYLWNNVVYLNQDGPTEAISQVWYVLRRPTDATAVSDNVDVHSGYERSVMKSWYMHKAYAKSKKYSTSEGYLRQFERAFRNMLKDRGLQVNPDNKAFTVHEDYGPLTG